MNHPRGLGRVRIVFFLYAIALATATHWPSLQVPVPGMSRSDMIAHAGVFGLWAALFLSCAWFGPVRSTWNILGGFAVSVAYAGLDESTQAIPIVQRYAGWDDFCANLLGVCAGVAAVVALGALDRFDAGTR